jgi:hypothetical protein
VTTKKTIQRRLNDRGIAGFFLVYPQNHGDAVYRILNLEPKQIIKLNPDPSKIIELQLKEFAYKC